MPLLLNFAFEESPVRKETSSTTTGFQSRHGECGVHPLQKGSMASSVLFLPAGLHLCITAQRHGLTVEYNRPGTPITGPGDAVFTNLTNRILNSMFKIFRIRART